MELAETFLWHAGSHKTVWSQVPEDSDFNSDGYENFKPHLHVIFLDVLKLSQIVHLLHTLGDIFKCPLYFLMA
jgi:hypothetical protein